MILKVDNFSVKVELETYDKIHNSQIIKQLKDYLSVRIDGYQYAQAYKDKRWDGYTSFMKYQKFPTGFLPGICNYLDEMSIVYSIADIRENMPEFKEDIVTSLGIFEGRDYQIPLVQAVKDSVLRGLPFHRGIIDAATNSGKNLITACIFASLVEGKRKGIFLVHTKTIYDQAVAYMSDYFDVGQVNDSNCDIREFTVCMYKTLLNRTESMNVMLQLSDVNAVFVDECHRACADDFVHTLGKINAGLRVGVSGTPLDMDSKEKKMIISGLFGKILGKVSNQDLIDRGVSARPIVHLWMVDNPLVRYTDYQTEVEYLIHENNLRYKILKDILSSRLDKSTLITFQFLAHGETILHLVKKWFPDVVVEMVHGKDKARAKKVLNFGTGKTTILISSMILKEGANLKIIRHLIRMEGGKSKITTKQLVGRTTREDEDKETVEIHDFYDRGKWVEEHSKKRALSYKKEGFEMRTDYKSTRGYLPVK